MTQTQTREITIIQALNEAIREEMQRDERVFIMGEDIQSGVYGASAGLFNEFGGERVRDCPLSENAFMGAAVGAAALAGLATGFWSDPSEAVDAADLTVFEPRIDAARRDELYAGWKRAVERSRDWERA